MGGCWPRAQLLPANGPDPHRVMSSGTPQFYDLTTPSARGLVGMQRGGPGVHVPVIL